MKYILIFIYLAVSILLFVLNWDLFTTALVLDIGFGEFNVWPFFILQIFGGVILGVFALADGYKDLKKEMKINELRNTITTMQKDAEIASLKKDNNVSKPENKKVSEIPGAKPKEY